VERSTSVQALGFGHAGPGESGSYRTSGKIRPNGVHKQIHVYRLNRLKKAYIETVSWAYTHEHEMKNQVMYYMQVLQNQLY